jgi:hypothetical protein
MRSYNADEEVITYEDDFILTFSGVPANDANIDRNRLPWKPCESDTKVIHEGP